MSIYISQARWTQQGAQNLKESPARLDDVKKSFQAHGVKVLHFFLTTGAHDILLISEAPNYEAMAKATLALISKGSVTTQTSRAFTEDEYRKLIGSL